MKSANMKMCVVLVHVVLVAITLANGDKIDIPIPCRNTSDCKNMSLPGDAFCQKGYCMCPRLDNDAEACSSINASMHENKTSGSLLYRRCKHEQDCLFEGGICNYTISQCTCLKNYVPSSNLKSCVQKIESFEVSCTDKNQCLAFLANTTCENSTCVCVSGYYYIDNACWKMAGYAEPCTKNQECSHIEGNICTDNKTCGCAAETVLNTNGTKCLTAAKKIQDECTELVQCTFEFTACVDNVCQCKEDFHYEREMTRCFPNKAIGNECVNNYECYQAEDYKNDPPIKSMMCDSNICTCADNYILNVEDKCVSKSASSSFMVSLSILVCVISLTVLS
ncbi:PREDICTED: uncharacterized protein LOC108771176 isoform X1 [Trachymyrmex cornetzi]|uniref:uncharacterized protein LOC108771176 isoform X1 n=1 Tax=Trachymyrmex cornetzi TaxID=471704 RepID=UPI00084EE409|nr:PREDICTED: uncharacterized protein LOC108771176 isoform X1 [Trachymyrmex cornetzi]